MTADARRRREPCEGRTAPDLNGVARASKQGRLATLAQAMSKNKADGGEEDKKQGLDVFPYQVVFQCEERDAYILVGFGVVEGEGVCDRVHVGAGLGEGDVGLETTDGVGAHVDASSPERRDRSTGRWECRCRDRHHRRRNRAGVTPMT